MWALPDRRDRDLLKPERGVSLVLPRLVRRLPLSWAAPVTDRNWTKEVTFPAATTAMAALPLAAAAAAVAAWSWESRL